MHRYKKTRLPSRVGQFCVFLSTCLLWQAAHAAPAPKARIVPSSYIVVYKPGVDAEVTSRRFTGRFKDLALQFNYRHAFRGAAMRIPPGLLQKVIDDPDVAYVEQDVIMSIAAQTLPTGVDRINADLDPTANIDGVSDLMDVDIAILDTGVDFNLSELNVHKYAYCKIQGFFANCIDNDPGAMDGNSHGTHVAGTAAAIDNTSSVVGVAPGARIWGVKVLEDDGNGTLAQVLAGVDYVTANAGQIEVANLSLSGGGSSPTLENAINNSVAAGVVYVVAAGNAKVDVSTVFPAGYNSVITVSAFSDFDGQPGGTGSGSVSFGPPASCTENVDDSFACFSNFGSGVDIMAPGIRIRSTTPSGTGIKDGTSMAAPHVAGAAALYLLNNPGATPATVKAALIAGGDPLPCGTGTTCSDDPDGIQEPLLMLGCADGDNDGICDVDDNCPSIPNPSQLDTDNDLAGDACDSDDDGDGLSDIFETGIGSNPLLTDSDGDGMDDYQEVAFDGDAGSYNPFTDPNPNNPDTDNDGLTDGDEFNIYALNPTVSNTGDVGPRNNPDDQINPGDLVVMGRLASGEEIPSTLESVLGDINDDAQVDLIDLLLLQKAVLDGTAP